MTSGTRAGNGRFDRDPDTAERDAQALAMRARGATYAAIAEALGFAAKSGAHRAVQRGLDGTLAEPAAELRKLELERLDHLTVLAYEVLERDHVTVSNGRVVEMDGKPLRDDGPVLAAIDRLLKIQERRARLLGLDAPVKAQTGVTIAYEIVGVSMDKL